jgi:hypothetical protein
MHRIDTDGNVSGMFSDGDPPHGVQATVVDDDWLNDVQENIVAVVLAGGLSLIKGTYTQLRDAISAMISAAMATFLTVTHTWTAAQTFGAVSASSLSVTGVGALTYVTSEYASGVANASGNRKMAYWVDFDGKVHLQGFCSAAAVNTRTLLTLPSGKRPSATVTVPVYLSGGTGGAQIGYLTITSAGVVSANCFGGTNTFANADVTVCFRPDDAVAP